MATVSSFGPGQNLMLMRNEMSRSGSLVAMLSSCNPHVGLQVPRSGGGLEDAIVGCGQKRPFSYPVTFDGAVGMEEAEDGDDGGDEFSHPVEKKRRLTFDQVRSLERNFEIENKLEPERKLQLAKELGLQPRQVAVWFQNRRARWKTKQLERDYEVLNSGYNKLKADLEVIVREKDVLKAEVQRLTGKSMSKSEDSQGCQFVESAQCGSETNVDSQKSEIDSDSPAPPSRSQMHHAVKANSPTVDTVSSAGRKKEKTDQTNTISSGSINSSDNNNNILDAESPRTTDSSNLMSAHDDLACQPVASYSCHQFPAPSDSFAAPNILHVQDEDLCNRSEVGSGAGAGFPVKLEDGCTFQVDPSCNYYLPQLDEHTGLPWWDWP